MDNTSSQNIFKISRFGKLFKLFATQNIKSTSIKAVVLFIVSFIILVLTYPNLDLNSIMNDRSLLEATSVVKVILWICTAILSLLIAIALGIQSASRGFSDYNKREKSWLSMMLPASQSEKYFSRMLWWGVCEPAVYMIAYVLSIVLSFLISPALNGSTNVLLQDNTFLTLDSFSFISFISSVVGLLSTQITFFAGGAVFNKHPILWTSVIWIGLAVIISKFTVSDVSLLDVLKGDTDLFQSPGVTLGMNLATILVTGTIGWFFFKRSRIE